MRAGCLLVICGDIGNKFDPYLQAVARLAGQIPTNSVIRLRLGTRRCRSRIGATVLAFARRALPPSALFGSPTRSEEHTSELQSLRHLVCRLLLEKKQNNKSLHYISADNY